MQQFCNWAKKQRISGRLAKGEEEEGIAILTGLGRFFNTKTRGSNMTTVKGAILRAVLWICIILN